MGKVSGLDNLSFARYLPKLSQYKDSEYFMLNEKDRAIFISYRTTPLSNPVSSTHFELQLEPNEGICYILGLNIEKSKRKQGIGRSLVRMIERICQDHRINRLVTTPSGQGREFWPKVGFVHFNETESEKII
jgi:GNAT superfamily N-acetyltransferase